MKITSELLTLLGCSFYQNFNPKTKVNLLAKKDLKQVTENVQFLTGRLPLTIVNPNTIIKVIRNIGVSLP